MAGKASIMTRGSSFIGKAMPGIAAFFGLEWATNGGIQDAAGGAFGVSDSIISLAMVGGLVVLGIYLINRYGDPKRATGGRRQ